jgi:septum formation protein
MPLWLDDRPLVLASKSPARRALLKGAGIPVAVHPADIDERTVERDAGGDAKEVAALLARAKAQSVAAQFPNRLVAGADQTLALGDRRFSKPADRAEARAQLQALRGRSHVLHSAVAVIRDGDLLFECTDTAHLTMRVFSDGFVEAYLDAVGDAATESVGGYQVERTGIQLFERIDGAHSTILGLPLLPLLRFLRSAGALAD